MEVHGSNSADVGGGGSEVSASQASACTSSTLGQELGGGCFLWLLEPWLLPVVSGRIPLGSACGKNLLWGRSRFWLVLGVQEDRNRFSRDHKESCLPGRLQIPGLGAHGM